VDKYKRRRIVDVAARRAITSGGVVIVVSILAMLAFLVSEVFPLFRPPRVTRVVTPLSGPPERSTRLPVAGADEYQGVFFAIDETGSAVLWDGQRSAILSTATLEPLAGSPIRVAEPVDAASHRWVVALEDGRVVPVRFDAGLTYDGVERHYAPRLECERPFVMGAAAPARALSAVETNDGFAVAALCGENGVWIARRLETRSLLGGSSVRDTVFAIPFPAAGPRPTAIVLDVNATHVYIGTDGGQLLEWDLASVGERPAGAFTAFQGPPVTCLGTLIGKNSIVVGGANGAVQVWFRAPDGHGQVQLLRTRECEPHEAAVVGITASPRNRTFLTWDERGTAMLRLGTTGATRKTVRVGTTRPDRIVLAPKANALFVSSNATISRWDIEDPHPELSWGALFGPVHYEGYAKPGYVWQSTGGTDESEPKLSLVPLIFGTLKGTLYAMCFSAPIAILAALYTAMFMRPELRRIIKPTMEVLATLPSVVLGLLAGLWLAPRLQASMPIVLLTLVAIAAAVIAIGWMHEALRARSRWHLRAGVEVLLLVPFLALALGIVFRLNAPLDALFPGGFLQWLYDRFDVRYDQRNAIVVGIAVGLAVIPIVFSVSEDSLSSVPRHLTAGSLALGATLWQTAWRVVLPAASPGIFSALMIGFGRAVGETMIMLMATGNTPIMDWSAFNGFRTLSANIATEIPEAPQGGTLYRVLFLSALLLFGFTLVVNTTAEIIRGALRKRYSRF
jgi:phosphate transport system permease protein